jgi:hypothetical protein
MNHRRVAHGLGSTSYLVTAVMLVWALTAGCDTLAAHDADPALMIRYLPPCRRPALPVGPMIVCLVQEPGRGHSSPPPDSDPTCLRTLPASVIQSGNDSDGGPFLQQLLGDPASIGQIFAETNQLFAITPDSLAPVDPAKDPDGILAFRRQTLLTLLLRPRLAETNLKIRPDRDLRLGSSVFPAGSEVSTGMDMAAGETAPVGLQSGGVSCAACHASVDPASGQMVVGKANSDLNIGLFLALSQNTTSSFLRFNKNQIDPFDPRFPPTGRRIIDSEGHTIQLPDPAALESAVDDLVLTIPPGGSTPRRMRRPSEQDSRPLRLLAKAVWADGGFRSARSAEWRAVQPPSMRLKSTSCRRPRSAASWPISIRKSISDSSCRMPAIRRCDCRTM